MQLQHIDPKDLKPGAINVRKTGGKKIDDLLPSIRSLGLLQPLLVRANCEGFEIVAGQRRYHALTKLAAETEGETEPDAIPCIVMDDGDDAKAIEASLAENVARLPMDEIDQYKAFAALLKAGRKVDDIASQFGVTERLVRQRLAIANLIGPVLTAYRKDEIDPGVMRTLTMATKTQQKKWMELHRSEEHYAPTGRALRHWLLGGATIPVANALFDVAASGLAVIGDLFGDEQYFADAEAFWPLQGAAVAELADDYRAKGWAEVIVHETGQQFPSWNYEKVGKDEGGEVHIAIASDGEVGVHEGVLDRDLLRKRRKSSEGGEDASVKPEITKAMQTYLALHRHAAVRADVLGDSGIALRLIAAHMIAGSGLWRVEAEPQKADKQSTADSLAACSAQTAFAEARAEAAKLIGVEPDEPIARNGHDWRPGRDIVAVFEVLWTLSDDDMIRILTVVMAETLEADTALVEHLGVILGTEIDPSQHTDEAFFDLLRDKAVINAMLKEVGGKAVAEAHVTSTAKVQKKIIRDYLDGTRKGGQEGWRPRYAAFPMKAYTERGGLCTVQHWQTIKAHHAG